MPPRRYALQSLFGPGQDGMTMHTPHAAHLGIRVVETGPAFGVCALPFREVLIGDPRRRVIFGGAITTLIDHTSGLAVACAVEELTAIATIDLRVDYLRAAEPDLELYARSDCYRLTRNVAFVRAVAWERTAGAARSPRRERQRTRAEADHVQRRLPALGGPACDQSPRRDLQARAAHRQRSRRRLAGRPQPPGGRGQRQVPRVLSHVRLLGRF